MTVSLLMRRAPHGRLGMWDEVASVRTRAEASDELKSWGGPRLHHGDLVLWREKRFDRLFVFNADTSGFVRAVRGSVPWLSFWEGEGANAFSMLNACGRVSSYRLASAAYQCALMVNDSLPPNDGPFRASLRALASWLDGSGDLDAVCRASELAGLEVGRVLRQNEALPYPYHHAAVAALNAAHVPCDRLLPAYTAAQACEAAAWAASDYRIGRRSSLDRLTPDQAAESEAEFASACRRMAPMVRHAIPLPVVLCAHLGLRDPLPIGPPKANPTASRPRSGR